MSFNLVLLLLSATGINDEHMLRHPMYQACRAEIVQIERFFELWMRGSFADSEAEIKRWRDMADPTFTFISVDGKLLDLEEFVTGMRRVYGLYRGRDYRVWVEKFKFRPVGPDLYLCIYEEWQELVGRPRRVRQSSALFRFSEETPNGVALVHVQETLIDGFGGR